MTLPEPATSRSQADLPTGPSVTFLFTDIEGSTRLERSVGSAAWATLVARHDDLVRHAIEGSGGVVVKTEGDAFFAAFADPIAAALAAIAAQRSLAAEDWPEGIVLKVRWASISGRGACAKAARPVRSRTTWESM
jgi:class 3 adenylate cyclase